MIRFDWNPFSDVTVTAVWVPIFRPAQLPRTAPLAVTQPERPAPVQETHIQYLLGFDGKTIPPDIINVNGLVPDPSIENSQVGVRVAGRLLGIDLSASYYHGRWGIPTPVAAIFTPPTFTNGVKGPNVVQALVAWPRVDVIGADLAGSIEKLKGLGYWLEAGLFLPQKVAYTVYNDNMGGHNLLTFQKNGTNPDTGEQLYKQIQFGPPYYDFPTVVPSTPFVKLTAGLDYSFSKYLYSNIQYVYGFIDEFGAGQTSYARPGAVIGDTPRREARIGHYLVLGSDLKLANDAVLIRFFGAFKVPQLGDDDPKFTAVLFPQIAWAVWDATELSLGAFVFLGDRDTKFGDPAAGASEIFAKARFTY
jgi:hypothetical protein